MARVQENRAPIETERLSLLPNSAQLVLALMEDPQRYEELAGFPAAAGLREYFTSGEVSQDFLNSLRAPSDPDPWRFGFAVVHRQERAVMGTGGYKGPPDASGMVEIAYGVAPAFQGRGYATEIARALCAYALESDLVQLLRAHTLPEPNASTRVLKKNGFEFVGEVDDPEDGRVWRWERPAIRSAATR